MANIQINAGGTMEIGGAGNEDTPASLKNDYLGFRPYVEGVYSFLVNPETKAPFTLSIEGEWGSGKSSFMLQLEDSLKAGGYQTIRFNAWRQDKVESMWAAFALTFMEKLLARRCFCERWIANLRLRAKRFEWHKGWLSIIKVAAMVLIYGYILFELLNSSPSLSQFLKEDKADLGSIIKVLGTAGTLVIFPLVLKQLAEIFGNPFKNDLEKFVNTPKYEGNVSFIEEFHKDFAHIIDVLTDDKEKIFVFVDDLDRADVPKAAELMQGLNMMIADSPRLIFIIGMDREKVAAGVSAKYKDLLPFLYPDKGPLNSPESFRNARDYGYRFIEKFIQLSFEVPRPSSNYTRAFIESLSGIQVQTNNTPVTYKPMLQITEGQDAAEFREVVFELASFFDHNPRRMKQFVNIFRLKAHISNSTGLFTESDENNGRKALTIPQLGKFVALTMLYPDFIISLEKDPDFLDKTLAKNSGPAYAPWIEHEGLRGLLFAEPDDLAHYPAWDMKEINWMPLLETTPTYKINTETDDFIPPEIPAPNDNPTSGSFSGRTTTTTRPPSSGDTVTMK
ncbi:hypothetical protein ABID99_003552 [Mucilaginibacter sp. OAE612]|uniref:KAP family P-loop NTPase fold protein n=1 Tax=Mucilaginibacter sp. OAE612 TaxID=3156444 RepID=UPI00359EDF67